MPAPHCGSTATTERPDRTAMGYRCVRCRACTGGIHERTGTPFNSPHDRTDVICLVVMWCFRYGSALHVLNWLRVLGTAERPHLDQGVRQQFHAKMSLLHVFETR